MISPGGLVDRGGLARATLSRIRVSSASSASREFPSAAFPSLSARAVRRSGGLLLLEAAAQIVDSLHKHEDTKGHDEEVEDVLQEVPVGEHGRAGGLGLHQSSDHVRADFCLVENDELSVKLTSPVTLLMGGIMMSCTMEVTILPNAAPMMTPTARSTTLPFIANSLNSLINPIEVFLSQQFAGTVARSRLKTIRRFGDLLHSSF